MFVVGDELCFLCVLQHADGSLFTLLVDLLKCGTSEKHTCLKSVTLSLHNSSLVSSRHKHTCRVSMTPEDSSLTYIDFLETFSNHHHSNPQPYPTLDLNLTLKMSSMMCIMWLASQCDCVNRFRSPQHK